ncbi:hypothetical protein SAMN05216223_113140 [Actinacidiphila yanglinensis]|uniref:Uncharacterized protein n=1 Tax=Actinacidiphila yanglinensis TaxID=310779 RepID=A0A1H6DAZ4_9ACTN|nr:hypothetical protein SAMN05216223_113140 [Actinacidiphila yanglinensis]
MLAVSLQQLAGNYALAWWIWEGKEHVGFAVAY